MRLAVSVFVLTMSLGCGHAYAQALNKPECTKANIDSTDEKIGKMPDGPRKATASTEIAAARKTLQAGQQQDCQDHLLKANVQTK